MTANLNTQTLSRIAWALLLSLTAVGISGCDQTTGQPGAAGPRGYPYRVTTTTGMITDIVKEVAGDKATVEGVITGSTDPHTFKPSRDDILALQQGDVVFYNGLMLEGKMTDLFVNLANDGKRVHPVTANLAKTDYVLSDDQDHYDPHVWMDVRGWMGSVEVVAAKLASFDPTNAAHYESRAKAYLAKLEMLDAYAREVIASIPETKRVLITAHDAFSYMGRAYKLKVMGVQGISTESEAGLRRINELVDFIVTNKIEAVFVEASVDEKHIKALVEGAGSRGHTVRIGGNLYSDSMGQAGTYEGTYIGMIDHNVSTIAAALGGKVPAGGFKAKLEASK